MRIALEFGLVACVALVMVRVDPAGAQAVDAEPPAVTVRTSIKTTGLLTRSPDAPTLFPDRTTAESMLRFRIEPEIRASRTTTFTVAYEQRLHYASAPTVGIGVNGLLPSERSTPFRVESLVWRMDVSDRTAWRHEIDRANAHVHLRPVDLTLGRQAIGWARENQALAGLENAPIRWICEDAMKFIQREERRGNTYDIILTDPPHFGRGTHGEIWQLFEHLPLMLDVCRDILSPKALGLVLTAYSIRASFYSMHELMRETMRGAGGEVASGELVIREAGLDGKTPGRALSTSLFSRWVPK